MSEFFCGAEFRAPYPFIRTTYEAMPEDPDGSPEERKTWRPGVDHECTDNFGSTRSYADRMGEVTFTVIGVFKPGSFPTRIFFVRKWQDPDGKIFGKGNLHITTQQNFRTLIKGYRHEFEMSEYEDD